MFDYMLTDEERSWRDKARIFVRDEVDAEYLKAMDRDEIRFPREVYGKFAAAGLLGLRFPKQYGGKGLSWVGDSAVQGEIGCLGMALGCAFVMPSIVGEALNTFGSEAQKEHYLAGMLRGELVSAEALTEPRGGSDFFGASSSARDAGDHYVLRGQKRFVVGAEGADFFLVYAKTNFDESASPYARLSAFIVDRCPEVEVKYKYGLMGTRGGGTGRILFRDVKVPKANLVGPLHGGALVFNQMMVPERLTSAAPCIGSMRAALEVAAQYANKRKAFGRTIRKFQGVSFMIADAVTKMDASRAMVYQAALAADHDAPNLRRIVSETKKFVTTSAWEVVNLAMQVTGGIGYTDVYPIERYVRDVRLAQIWTGTNEIMSTMIQHEYYKEFLAERGQYRDVEGDAMHPDDSEKVFDDDDMWGVFEKES